MNTLIDTIKKAENVLLVCHVRPDGDCLGAGFAVMRVCEKLGKNTDFVCDSPLPAHYSFLPDGGSLNDEKFFGYDLAIAVDCADEFRMGKFGDVFFSVPVTINIDHHITNTNFASVNIVKGDASSTCEILFDLFKCGYIDEQIAEYLYMGISTDTGHFRHNNTSPETLIAAADLVRYKFDVSTLIDNLYRSNPIGKLKLIGVALNKMRFFENNRICIIALSQKDIAGCDCSLSDTEGIIDYPMTIKEVEVAVCMSQQSGSSFKVSFRSKGPDVAAIAGKFGGGGHILASGCVVNGDFNGCVNKVVAAITEDIK